MIELGLGGRIAYLLGQSVSYSVEEHPVIGSVQVCTKWKTEYLVSQIIDAVAEHMKRFPTSPWGLSTVHAYTATDSMIRWLRNE